MFSIKLGIVRALKEESKRAAGGAMAAALTLVAEPGLAEAANDDESTISALRKRVTHLETRTSFLERELRKTGWVEGADEKMARGPSSELDKAELELVLTKDEAAKLEEKIKMLREDVNTVGYSKALGRGHEELSDDERSKIALRRLAQQWHSEIVGEKMSLLCAAAVAYVHFGEYGVDSLPTVAKLAAIYFGFELLTDAFFVYALNEYFEMPMLELELEPLFTKDGLAHLFALSLMCTSMAGCIGMAAMVPLN